MEFKIEKRKNYTFIQVLEEKLDTHIAPTLKSELVLVSGNGEKNIVLDLSKCRYCDSSGLSAFGEQPLKKIRRPGTERPYKKNAGLTGPAFLHFTATG